MRFQLDPKPAMARPFWSDVAFATIVIAGATLFRWGLGLAIPGILPFAVYFPAILVTVLYGGQRSGVIAILVSLPLGWFLFGQSTSATAPTLLINFVLFAASMAAVFASGMMANRLGSKPNQWLEVTGQIMIPTL